MNDNLTTAEQRFNEFLPVLKEFYPKGRNDSKIIKELNDLYAQVTFNENVMVVLFDHRTFSVVFVSENVERLTAYKRADILKWGGLVLFKALHYSHYSYIYRTLKLGRIFNAQLSLAARKDIQFYCCGLKAIDGNKRERRLFLKSKVLLLDEQGQTDVSIFFVEDVEYLMKGGHYWIRNQCQDRSLAYVHQKGKKDFKDLFSAREKEVLELVAERKSTAEIADILQLSKFTIETHRKNMIKRVGAVDATALVHLSKMAGIFKKKV